MIQTEAKTQTELLLGDEAVARAAIDSGIGGAFSYPGTPATEIFEYLERWACRHGGFSAKWSGNEKVAYEEALGMSYVGKRAIVSMKSVGLNVAADPFMSSALTGANGGLVVAVADDPGMHSSQNEQDARYYADFARIPCLEPSDQQECYDMTREAFELSEKHHIPILVRLVTRLAHSRSMVHLKPQTPPRSELCLVKEPKEWILMPSNARPQFAKLLGKRNLFQEYSETSPWNIACDKKSGGKGVLCSGTGYNYLREAFSVLGKELPYVKIGFYPLPPKKLTAFMKEKDEILVLEDGYPYIEEHLLGLIGHGPKIKGRKDGTLSETGELNPDHAARALQILLGEASSELKTPASANLPNRPPSLCPGCSHIDTYKALNEAVAALRPCVVFSDIGCYTLGALEPYKAIHSCVEMGASIGMARGAAEGGLKHAVAVIGDSTFEHSGLSALLGASVHDAPMTVIILDNGTVAMTGAQQTLVNDEELVRLVKGLGVPEQHIRTILPLPKNHEENVRIIADELDHRGLSVILARRECVQAVKKKPRK